MDDRHRACSACDGEVSRSTRRTFLREGALAVALIAGGRLPLSAAAAVREADAAVRIGGRLLYDVPSADGATVDREHQVIVVRWEGRLYAFWLSCPHQRTALRWDQGDARFQCPKHRSKYAPDGLYLEGRATRSMDRYAVALVQGRLEVDTAVLHREDENPGEWTAAFVSLAANPSNEGGNR